jgi:hypothetical protein
MGRFGIGDQDNEVVSENDALELRIDAAVFRKVLSHRPQIV